MKFNELPRETQEHIRDTISSFDEENETVLELYQSVKHELEAVGLERREIPLLRTKEEILDWFKQILTEEHSPGGFFYEEE